MRKAEWEREKMPMFEKLTDLCVRSVYCADKDRDRSSELGKIYDAKWFTSKRGFNYATPVSNPDGYSYWLVVMDDGTMFIVQDLKGGNGYDD